ncbi:MAG: hypothetical protein Q8O59_02270 [bacterium]|nr:hypothetical protein [bacterium]
MAYWRNDKNKLRRLGGDKKYVYAAKSYKNPFFQTNRAKPGQGKLLSNKAKLIIFAAAIAAGIIIWLIFFSTLFKLEKIEVNGADAVMAGQIRLMARELAEDRLMGKNNLLLYNKSELTSALNEKYFLENLSVNKKLPHSLIINFQEKQRSIIWKEGENYYYLDNRGNVISQVDPLNISGGSYPLVENFTEIKIDGRQANISEGAAYYILNLFNQYKNKSRGFDIERFIIDQDINTVKMAVLSGPKIYFNIKEAAQEQTDKLNLILSEKLKNNFMDKEYIDLRYANNIYIK